MGWGGWREITLGEMPDVGDGRMETANHRGMCVPMQQSCKICICTPELEVQLKKNKKKKERKKKDSKQNPFQSIVVLCEQSMIVRMPSTISNL